MSEITNPSEIIEQYEAAKAGEAAADGLRGKAIAADPNAPRMFLCPVHPSGRFLVKAGVVRYEANTGGGNGMKNASAREGDVWVKFTSGIYALHEDDENHDAILAWLEAHSGDPELHTAYHDGKRGCQVPVGLCQESGEGVADWLEMKEGQVSTAKRDFTINPNMDVDGYFIRGKVKRHLPNGIGARLEETAESNRSAYKQRANRQE